MITLTTEIRSKRFRESEKDLLFSKLKTPILEKRRELEKSFKEYLDQKVIGSVLDPDLLELGEKSYCKHSTCSFSIFPGGFGLDRYYIGKPEFKSCSIDSKFCFYSKDYRIAADTNYGSYEISSHILEKGSAEIIEQVKYFLYEYAKIKYEDIYFGLGTIIRPKIYGNRFPGILTWGNLYDKCPEYFEILYKEKMGKSLIESKDDLNYEKKLLAELKIALGY